MFLDSVFTSFTSLRCSLFSKHDLSKAGGLK